MCLSSRMKPKDLHIIKTDIINLYAMELPMKLCGYKATTEDDYAKILAAGSGHILIDASGW